MLVFAVAAVIASTTYGVSNWLVAVKPPVTMRARARAEASPSPRRSTSGSAIGCRRFRSHDTAAARRAHEELSTLMRDNVVIAPDGAPENFAPPFDPQHPLAVFADDAGYQY